MSTVSISSLRERRDAIEDEITSMRDKIASLSQQLVKYDEAIELLRVLGVEDDPRRGDWHKGWHYTVPSRNHPGKRHEVIVYLNQEFGAGEVTCSCPASRYGNKCWAVKAVEGHGKMATPPGFNRVLLVNRQYPDFGKPDLTWER